MAAKDLFKDIDHDTDCLISGYIREIQQIFPKNDTFYIIPKLVYYKCLSFYYSPEQFMKCGSFIKMTEDGHAIQHILNPAYRWVTASSQSVLGKIKLDGNSNCIYCWKFQIFSSAAAIKIGITSAEDIDVSKGIEYQGIEAPGDFYLYSCGGWRNDVTGSEKYGNGFDLNNYVLMKVIPSKQRIEYIISKDEVGRIVLEEIVFENIVFKDKIYQMGISMAMKNAGVRLIEFSKEYNQ